MSKTDCIKRAIILANNIAINSRKNDALFCKSNYIADPNKCFVLNCFVKPVEVSPFFFILYFCSLQKQIYFALSLALVLRLMLENVLTQIDS